MFSKISETTEGQRDITFNVVGVVEGFVWENERTADSFPTHGPLNNDITTAEHHTMQPGGLRRLMQDRKSVSESLSTAGLCIR
jgi:hypothetical protein